MKAGPRNAPDGADSGGPGGPWSGTWLVLGGGGLKGLAHIGAWRALHEAGIRPEGIVGTSIGALVGALIAGGTTPEQMRAHGLALRRTDIARVNRRAAWINGIRQTSVFRGEPLFAHLEAVLPRRGWNALEIPLLMNAVDLEDGSTEWFGSGARMDVTLAEAVYASSALPVFYPPFETGGHAYVDGGIGGTLPIRKAEEGGAKRIITVDVGAGGKSDTRRVLDGGMIAIHQRVVGIMMWERRHEVVSSWEGPPLVYVRPRLAGFGTFDFGHAAHFMDEGYRAMREALASS